MIDVTDVASLLTMEQVWLMYRPLKKRLHIKTVYDWTSPTDKNGNPKLYLETAMLGGIKVTNRAALQRFAQQQEQLTAPPQATAEPLPSRPPSTPLPIVSDALLAGLRRHGLSMPGGT
jgi:hypothetical protein